MKNLVRSLLRKQPSRASTQAALLQIPLFPGAAYIVGDVHGRLDLLMELLGKLDAHIPVVFLGDYVDRGEDSADVVDFLHKSQRFTCLLGNHEAMLLDFLDDPSRKASRWFRNGGLQTLLSYGVNLAHPTTDSKVLMEVSLELRRKMGDDLIAWLRDLPHYLHVNNVVVVHAALDPDASVEGQTLSTMLWGHSKFLKTARTDGNWVVHGHTIVDAPTIENGRIAIDTGAYASGKLTAAFFNGGMPTFIQTGTGTQP